MSLTRSPFLQTRVDGGVGAIILANAAFAPGNVFFVNSTHNNKGDSAGKGQTPDAPCATIDYAVGLCTAAQGDIIFAMPGHVETVSTANGLDFDVAGITVYFLGEGGNQASVNFTGTAATCRINANNVTLVNPKFTGGIDAVVLCVDINGKTDVTLKNVTYVDVTGQCTTFLKAANNSDRLTIDGLKYIGDSAAGTTRAIAFDGCDDLQFRGPIEIVGNFSQAAIEFITTLSARMRIHGPFHIWNQNSADVSILDTITGSTGNISGPGYLRLTDNAANITEAITGATFALSGDNIYVVNLPNEKAMTINWTASTDA